MVCPAGRGTGVVKTLWANRPARSPAFSMGCNKHRVSHCHLYSNYPLHCQYTTASMFCLYTHVLMGRIVGVDERRLWLCIVIVFILVLLGLPSFVSNLCLGRCLSSTRNVITVQDPAIFVRVNITLLQNCLNMYHVVCYLTRKHPTGGKLVSLVKMLIDPVISHSKSSALT